MYKNKRILAIIPARGGSKGIPHKNIIRLSGKPLIVYTIEAALASGRFDDVIVSTDDDQIAYIAIKYGASVPCLRPSYLAEDTSKTVDAVLYTLDCLKKAEKIYDIVVLLQPTSPFRDANDISNAIDLFIDNDLESLVSVSPVSEHPLLIRQMDINLKLTKLLNFDSSVRRQDFPPYYIINGAIYINYMDDINSNTSFNDNLSGYLMDSEHSIDIDDPLDLLIAEVIISKKAL
ncbi:MAG: acylneuraminate cytidylyltransferase family protein [Paludibacter sp.]|nr:acylneuraminate cytidylyltransferase family protein [Paludibacter sp.]